MNKTKKIILTVASAVLLFATVGTTLAYLVTSDGPLTNTFNPSRVINEVDETFDGSVKENVTIKNTGDTDAYIRARIVATWVKTDASGKVASVYPENPVKGVDYTIIEIDDSAWEQKEDGCYYYTEVVIVGEKTTDLIGCCVPVEGKAPEGYVLSIEIISQAIQAEPFDGYEEAWASALTQGN